MDTSQLWTASQASESHYSILFMVWTSPSLSSLSTIILYLLQSTGNHLLQNVIFVWFPISHQLLFSTNRTSIVINVSYNSLLRDLLLSCTNIGLKMYLLQSYLMVKKKKRHWDPARIWTWVFWMLVRCSYQLHISALGIGKTLNCMAFLLKGKCFWSTPDGVLTAHGCKSGCWYPACWDCRKEVPWY